MSKYFYCLFLLLIPFSGMAATITASIGDLRYILNTSTHTAEVTYKAGFNTNSTLDNYSMATLVVPSSVEYEGEDYVVTSIGEYAFKGCYLKEIQLPTSLRVIGKFSFMQCTDLPSVIIPEGVTDIEEYAFYQCVELSSVIFPTTLKRIGNCGFYNCYKLTTIIAPGPDYIVLDTINVFGNYSQQFANVYVSAKLLGSYSSQFSWFYFRNFYAINPVTSISIEGRSHTIEVDETLALNATVTPATATVTALRWESSNPTIASVDDSGVVTGITAGNTIISACAIDGSGVTGTFDITVLGGNPVTGIIIDGNNIKNLKTTETLQLMAILLPEDADYSEVSWNSSDPTVATVSDEGLVTAVSEGNVVITASLTDQPEIKDTYSLDIQKRMLGDSNDNGIVTVADVITTANDMIDIPVADFCFVNADVNSDKVLTPADITGTVNIIIGVSESGLKAINAAASSSTSDRLVAHNFRNGMAETVVDVKLDNSRDYSALMATVAIPDGMKVKKVKVGPEAAAHSLMYNISDEGYLKIIIFSYSNEVFGHDQSALFTIVADTENMTGNLEIFDIIASDSHNVDYNLSYACGFNVSGETGVGNIVKGEVKVNVLPQCIEVCGAEGLNVGVYTFGGEIITTVNESAARESFSVIPGMYIVRAGEATFKVAVK